MSNSIGPQRGMPRVLRYVWVSILLFTCSVVFAQNPNTLIRDIVLVHGAWRVLALQDGPCILVAHSISGAVIA